MKKVIVICGPTASGKTALSLQLAKYYQLDIINGDSVQIFQGYDIGSAKIKVHEQQDIKHHLLSIIPSNQTYDVAQYQHDVRDIINKKKVSMIVGGTGLYIKAALYDYRFSNDIKTNDIKSFPDALTMYREILNFDPKAVIDIHNTKRLQRNYLKVLSGQKPSENNFKHDPLYDVFTIYLDIPKTELKERLYIRLENQLNEGFIEEVKHLKSIGQVKDVIGYRELNQYLDGEMSLDEAKHLIIKKSLAFAKRQRTWFLNQMNPFVIDATSKHLKETCIKEINAWIK